MKINHLKVIFFSLAVIFFSNQSFAALNGGSSTVSSGSIPNKSFSESGVAIGVFGGFRFNMVENIFTDLEESDDKVKDHIFIEPELFANQFVSGEIKQNLGARVNLGYEIFGIRAYGSGGYVLSTMDYQETGSTKQSVNKTVPFFGFGLGYDISKNTSVRLNSMFYNFDFTPKNSGFKNVEVNVSAVTLGIGYHF